MGCINKCRQLFHSDARLAKASTECEGAKQKHGPDFGYLGLPRTNTENAANGLEGFELNTRHKLWKFGSIQFICIFLSV